MVGWILIAIGYVLMIGGFRLLGGVSSAMDALRSWGSSTCISLSKSSRMLNPYPHMQAGHPPRPGIFDTSICPIARNASASDVP